jgi:hypothetical protein
VGFSFGWWINQKGPSPKENKCFGSPPLPNQLINTNHMSPKKTHTHTHTHTHIGEMFFSKIPTTTHYFVWWANQKGSLQKQTSDFGRMYFFPNEFLFFF